MNGILAHVTCYVTERENVIIETCVRSDHLPWLVRVLFASFLLSMMAVSVIGMACIAVLAFRDWRGGRL